MGWGRAAPGWSRSHVPHKSSPGNETRAGRGMRRDWKNDSAQDSQWTGQLQYEGNSKKLIIKTERYACAYCAYMLWAPLTWNTIVLASECRC